MKSFPWRTLLLVSAAVNLLLIGAIAGNRMSQQQNAIAKAEQAVGRTPNLRPLLEALPPERAAELRRELAAVFLANRDKRAAARAAREKVLAVGLAEPFDGDAMRAAFADMRARDGALAAAFHDATVEALLAMTPEERTNALKRLERAGQKKAEGPWQKRRAEMRRLEGQGEETKAEDPTEAKPATLP